MGSSSAAFRRWTSRSNRNPTYLFTAKRMITSGGVSTSPSPSSSPLLMMNPLFEKDGPGRAMIRFYSLATNQTCNFCTPKYRILTDEDYLIQILGSSKGGMLGLYTPNNHHVWLFDPFTDRLSSLPSLGTVVHALTVVGNTRLPVAAAGSGRRLALCRSGIWTFFPSDRACENLSYSTRYNRLFCITRNNDKSDLEIWDLGDREPKLEWKMDLDVDYGTCTRNNSNDNNLKKLMYVACAEHSGEVFVVVRHVRIRQGKGGYFVDGIDFTDYIGEPTTIQDPFKTDYFKVYKVDQERRRLILMKDSLEGLAIFVGTNHPLAIPAKEVAGVKPDFVYFTYDRRIRYTYDIYEPVDEASRDLTYAGEDNGTYNYRNMTFSPVCTYNHDLLPRHPLWFTSL